MTSSYNSIQGTDSANTLIGSTGADSFVALDGDDNILAAQSNDIVDLGDGQDTVAFNEDAMVLRFTAKAVTTPSASPLLSRLQLPMAVRAMTPFGSPVVLLELSTATPVMTASLSRV